MKNHLIRYAKGLVGQYYQTPGNKKLVIRLGGAPSLPSSGDYEASLVDSAGFDLIRPEYYGYARSDGFFSPKNCIQTVYDTIQIFKTQGILLSVYENEEIVAPLYDEIVIIGHSYGGRIAAAMPKFDEIIREILLLAPWFAPDDLNQLGYPEETDEEFLRQLLLGYKPVYRFEAGIDPYDALLSIDPLFSLSELGHLSETKVFVGHGSADEVVWCGRSRQFVDSLRQEYLDGNYQYAEYYGLGHGGICKQASLAGWLHRRKQFEDNNE